MIAAMIGWVTQVMPVLLGITGVVAVRGTSDCPSPAAVADILPGLSATSQEPENDVVSIDDAGSDLAITILAADGSIRLSRRLPRPDLSPATCSALASAVAVMIATWAIKQDPELSLLQPGVHPLPPAPATFDSVPPEPPGLSGGAEFSLGVALGMSMSGSGVVATGEAHLALRRARGRFGLWLTLAVDGEGTLSQAGGVSSWRRTMAGVGPWVALGQGRIRAEVGAELFLGRTTVQGSGFAVDRSDQAISLGVEGLARLLGPGHLQPFVEGGLREWLSPQEVDIVDANQASGRAWLPRLDGRLVVGVRARFGT